MGPILASVSGLEFDVKIGRYLGPDDRLVAAFKEPVKLVRRRP